MATLRTLPQPGEIVLVAPDGSHLQYATLRESAPGGIEQINEQVTQAGHGFRQGEQIYLATDGAWKLAAADHPATLKQATASDINGDDFTAVYYGLITWVHGLTVGAAYYLSPLTPGAVVTPAPFLPGVWVQRCFEVMDDSTVRVVDRQPSYNAENAHPYILQSDTTAADPGEGNLRLNNATPWNVTEVYQSLRDQKGLIHREFAALGAGDDLWIRQGAGTAYHYEIVSSTFQGSWYQFAVTNDIIRGPTIAPLPQAVTVSGQARLEVGVRVGEFVSVGGAVTVDFLGVDTAYVRCDQAAVAVTYDHGENGKTYRVAFLDVLGNLALTAGPKTAFGTDITAYPAHGAAGALHWYDVVYYQPRDEFQVIAYSRGYS